MLPGLRTVFAAKVKLADSQGGKLVAGGIIKELWGTAVASAGGETARSQKDLLKALCFAAEIGETVDGV